MESITSLLENMINGSVPSVEEISQLLLSRSKDEELIYSMARDLTRKVHGDEIHLRGLIEFSNRCKNDCYYCGIRAGSSEVTRYRMTLEEILAVAGIIKESDCGTVVLQCGVDPSFTAENFAETIKAIKQETGLAITLSIGTKTRDELKILKEAGADRCLLRFETCNKTIFNRIHPCEPFEERIECIENLKSLDFQTGSGFMIGLPDATVEDIAKDILFTKKLGLDMIGCGPFIPAPGTPLEGESVLDDYTIYFKTMALIRIMNPDAHIPAATAFDSLRDDGRNEVMKCGANVFMPNFTPVQYKENYNLYPGKPKVDKSVNIIAEVRKRIESLGRKIGTGAGHALRIG